MAGERYKVQPMILTSLHGVRGYQYFCTARSGATVFDARVEFHIAVSDFERQEIAFEEH